MAEPVVWTLSDGPRSARFNDVYHSRTGGLAQAQTVFLNGCGLPGRWHGKAGFTVLETGFGLGLNFLATWAAWEADPKRSEGLHFVSVEAYPVAADDIVRGARLPSPQANASDALQFRVQELARELAGAWKEFAPGIHVLCFARGRVVLALAVGWVQAMLEQLVCEADAVYLDGFSPALNPDMWSPVTLAAVARHCRPGTRLATYSSARPVREALGQLGFSVQRIKGLPPKRHRLIATFRREQETILNISPVT